MKIYTKKEAISTITKCAKLYKDNFMDCNLLFVYFDKSKKVATLEVLFEKSNFLHLTGLTLNSKELKAKYFFEKCINNKLAENDFELDGKKFVHQKLLVMSSMFNSPYLKINMIGNYKEYHPKLFTNKIAGNTVGCLGFYNIKNKIIPNTLLKEDVRDIDENYCRVIATYKKPRQAKIYTNKIYNAKGINLDTIDFPEKIEYLKSINT